MSDATLMLAAVERGDPNAAEQLLGLVYKELRRLAAYKMAQELPGQTLQPTALVHEAWLRLVGDQSPSFSGRNHFFCAAAEAMRRILIESARHKRTQRRGGGLERADLDDVEVEAPAPDDQLLAVHEALEKLAFEYPVRHEQGIPTQVSPVPHAGRAVGRPAPALPLRHHQGPHAPTAEAREPLRDYP